MSDCKIQLPKDTVIGKTQFGGYVYAVTVDFGGTQSASSLKLSLVTEKDAQFRKPTLKGYTNVTDIQVGNGKVFKGYLSSYKIHSTADKKIMEVNYLDGSIILDRIQVGLYKRHSDTKGLQGNLIVVGKEYHPCDKNFDSTVDFTYQEGGYKIDWCDPCPFCPPEKYKDTCAKETRYYLTENGQLEIGAILPVRYTFNELLGVMKSKLKINVNSQALDNDNNMKTMPAEYTGALREVLASWCADFGFSYYWDFFNNSLNFVDLKVPAKINFDYSSLQNITTLAESETLENTSSTSFISYYERDGSEQTYTCGDDRVVGLTPVFYKDILDATGKAGDEKSTPTGESWDSGMGQKEMACALAYYSQALWECYLFFNVYKMWSAEAAYNYKDIQLTHLGNMKVLEVCAPSKDTINSFTRFLNCLNKEQVNTIIQYNNKAENRADGLYYYFVVADVDMESLGQRYNKDQDIAHNLMGKFWYRKYSPAICGGNCKDSQVSIESQDGSGEFFPFGRNFTGHSLTQFGYAEKSKIGELVKESVKADLDNTPTVEFDQRTYKTTSSFIMAQRDAKWYPSAHDTKDYDELFAFYRENLSFKAVGTDGRPDALLAAYPKAKDNKNIRVFLCRSLGNKTTAKYSGLPITESKIDNFYEVAETKKLKRTRFQDRKGEPYKDEVIGEIGLTKKTCKWVTYDGFGFMMPVGSSYYAFSGDWEDQYKNLGTATVPSYQITSSQSNTPDAVLRIRASQTYDTKTYLPKIQLIQGTPVGSPTRRHQVLHYQFGDDVKAEGYCGPDKEKIQTRHATMEKFAVVQNTQSQKTVSFSVAGVFPANIGISDGLDSFSITFDDSGVVTEYSLSNKYAQPLPIDTLKRMFDRMTNFNSLKSSSRGAELIQGEAKKLNVM